MTTVTNISSAPPDEYHKICKFAYDEVIYGPFRYSATRDMSIVKVSHVADVFRGNELLVNQLKILCATLPNVDYLVWKGEFDGSLTHTPSYYIAGTQADLIYNEYRRR